MSVCPLAAWNRRIVENFKLGWGWVFFFFFVLLKRAFKPFVYLELYARKFKGHTYTHTHTNTHTHTHTHTHKHTHTHIHIHAHTHTHCIIESYSTLCPHPQHTHTHLAAVWWKAQPCGGSLSPTQSQHCILHDNTTCRALITTVPQF